MRSAVVLLIYTSFGSLNKPYKGKWNWIVRKGNKLMEDDKEFRFASYNVPSLLMNEDSPPIKLETLYGIPICKNKVSNPTYDSNGYGYRKENNKGCIIPKKGEADLIGGRGNWVSSNPIEIEDAMMALKGFN